MSAFSIGSALIFRIIFTRSVIALQRNRVGLAYSTSNSARSVIGPRKHRCCCIEGINEVVETHSPHKGIFISRTLYHSGAINVELSDDTISGGPDLSGHKCVRAGRVANAEISFAAQYPRCRISGIALMWRVDNSPYTPWPIPTVTK